MKLPLLAKIIFIATVVQATVGLLAFGTSYALDSEYYSSDEQTRFVVSIVAGLYALVFSIAALGKKIWGLVGYRLGLVAVGLFWVFGDVFSPGGLDVFGFLFMLLLCIGFLFPIWRYLGSKDVMAVYAPRDSSTNSEEPGPLP